MNTAEVSMQGGGLYNENSSLQELAVDKSVELLSPDGYRETSITLADYGSSEGENSIRLFSKYLAKLPAISSAVLIFNDTSTNDFSSLSTTINISWSDHSHNGKLAIRTLLSPRSFFQQVLPDNSTDAGFSFTALHWLQNMPDHLPGAPEISVAAHHDLVSFLSCRFKEIRSHGTLTFGVPIDGPLSVIPAHKCLEMALSKLSSTYQIDPSIISRLLFYIRTMDEILAAVAVVDGQWHLKSHHTIPVVHPMWPSPTEVG
ncbi:hypothetical protein ACLX1H_007807 [Fusarium chlamydosporum]